MLVFFNGNGSQAYSQLHSLAQDFDKPFDAPAIVVIGSQTDGKSALVEALMGFQFNHVGGGTKTRRPIALHMKYNASCIDPACYLVKEDGNEEEMDLNELQEHIEAENKRLEEEGGFWSKDIVAKIEYKFCPNLTIVDTPGLIAAAPGRRNNSLQSSAKAVEQVAKGKMEQEDHIILCLEDTSDWSNATTRRLVMHSDPELRRTVLVSTKLDTRLPQFARAADVELFIRPPKHLISPSVLGGGPFFTSVPSGRVGSGRGAAFRSNEHFREALAVQEQHDVTELERRMDRRLDAAERSHIGVSQLRRFLEKLLQRRYLENVPSIVPVLEREQRNASTKLRETERELESLESDKLKERGRQFYSAFLNKLPLLLRGTMMAPPSRFGETLNDEHIRGGSFIAEDGKPLYGSSAPIVANSDQRLFGGAQYHRALEEFRVVVGSFKCPTVTKEDVVNASGMDELHDGANYARTACVIAVAKARDLLEPFMHQLGYRLAHIARRLLPISMYLLQREGKFLHGHERFLKAIGSSFHAFVDECQQECQAKCLEDLRSTTEFVSWSLHSGNSTGLRSLLTSPQQGEQAASSHNNKNDGASYKPSDKHRARLVELVENTLWSRSLADVTHEVIATLVNQVFDGIRDHFVQSAELKFNCFFLMPIINDFPSRLRSEMERAFAEDLDGVFDVASARASLERQTERLEREMTQMQRIQDKFSAIHAQLCNLQQPPPTTSSDQHQPHTHSASTPSPPPAYEGEKQHSQKDLPASTSLASSGSSKHQQQHHPSSHVDATSQHQQSVQARAPLSPLNSNYPCA